MDWRGFWVTTISIAVGLSGTIFALVLVVDPYDTIFFSPPFDREPVTTNQRFSFRTTLQDVGASMFSIRKSPFGPAP